MNPQVIDTFNSSLKLMGEGMGGIFVVILIFYGLIVGLNKLFPEK